MYSLSHLASCPKKISIILKAPQMIVRVRRIRIPSNDRSSFFTTLAYFMRFASIKTFAPFASSIRP